MADGDVVEVRLALVLVAQQPREHVVGHVLAGPQPRLASVDQPVEVRAPLRGVVLRALAHRRQVADVDEQLREDVARPAQLRRRVRSRRAEVVGDDTVQRRVGELGDDVDLAVVAARGDELAGRLVHRAGQPRQVLARDGAVHRRVVVVIQGRVVDAEDERAGDRLHLRAVEVGGEARRVPEHLDDVLVQRDDRHAAGQLHDRVVVAHDLEALGRALVGEPADEIGDLLGQLVALVAQPGAGLPDLVDDAQGTPRFRLSGGAVGERGERGHARHEEVLATARAHERLLRREEERR